MILDFSCLVSMDVDFTTWVNKETQGSGIDILLCTISRQNDSSDMRGSMDEEMVDKQFSFAFST